MPNAAALGKAFASRPVAIAYRRLNGLLRSIDAYACCFADWRSCPHQSKLRNKRRCEFLARELFRTSFKRRAGSFLAAAHECRVVRSRDLGEGERQQLSVVREVAHRIRRASFNPRPIGDRTYGTALRPPAISFNTPDNRLRESVARACLKHLRGVPDKEWEGASRAGVALIVHSRPPPDLAPVQEQLKQIRERVEVARLSPISTVSAAEIPMRPVPRSSPSGKRTGKVDQAIALLKMDRERLTENSESDPRYKSMKAVADIVKCSPSTLKGSVAFRKEWDLFLPYQPVGKRSCDRTSRGRDSSKASRASGHRSGRK